MNTIKLSDATWGLMLDSSGNIALATDGEAISQDVASAISTFLGECYYDTTIGVPWQSKAFGEEYSESLVIALLEKAALTVPGVVSASATITSFNRQNRQVTGTIEVIDTTGQQLGVSF